MKKFLFVCVAFAASFLFTNTTHAQTQKIGYFDEQRALLFFPGIGKVDTLLQIYQQDSLRLEYEARVYEFQRADSIFKKDSAAMPAKARELAIKDMNQKRAILVQWQQVGQEMYTAKMDQLLGPYKQKMFNALQEVIKEQKYTYVLNGAQGQALSQYAQPPILDDLSIRVAIKLKLPLPKELEDAWKVATGAGSAPAGAPKK